MLKNTILILLFWVGLAVLPGCGRYPCNCPEIAEKYIDIEGVSGGISKKSATYSVDVKTGEKLNWVELVSFYARYKTRTYARQSPTENVLPSFGMVAYACDCNTPGYLGTQEKLKFMTIKTVYDFDTAHPAGGIINELVSIKIFPNSVPLNNYFSNGPVPYTDSLLAFTVTQAPANKGPFALEITVELDNGETYTARTPLIELI